VNRAQRRKAKKTELVFGADAIFASRRADRALARAVRAEESKRFAALEKAGFVVRSPRKLEVPDGNS
jgi:hypothetical protein